MKKSKKLQALTPYNESEGCDNCFKHPCHFHLKAGEDASIFCDNYEYLDFRIVFGGSDIKKLSNEGLKNVK